jgi:hypothetical protein
LIENALNIKSCETESSKIWETIAKYYRYNKEDPKQEEEENSKHKTQEEIFQKIQSLEKKMGDQKFRPEILD